MIGTRPSVATLVHQKAYRMVPSKYPPISLFDDVADQASFDALYAVQARVNPRIRNELGEVGLVPESERPFGIRGCHYAMAPFTHLSPDGSRFSNGDFGVFYCARERIGAVDETVYHMQKWLGYTQMEPQDISMRCLKADFSATGLDIRGGEWRDHEYHAPDNYSASRQLGLEAKRDGREAIFYQSVRHRGVECYALLTPRVLHSVIQSTHYGYLWNGTSIDDVYEKRVVKR
ncbi:RES family NAD+ phosphorylase [Marinobacter sp.]|uniref:RES family NAD+ phosphorylase n=1 Tax=Marinobacter sp. TaxID=50741 RepID=UPI0038516456